MASSRLKALIYGKWEKLHYERSFGFLQRVGEDSKKFIGDKEAIYGMLRK